MWLLGAFLRLLVAGTLGAPPAPVRAEGREGGRGRGSPDPRCGCRDGRDCRDSSSRRWAGGGGGSPRAAPPELSFPSLQAPEEWGTTSTESPVLTFREIWNRSFCRPLEQLVDVITEFPNEVEYIFTPSCVSLKRCGGCCGDEGLRCVPVETSTVTMQLLKIKPNGEAPYVEMAFTEHKQCECSQLLTKELVRSREEILFVLNMTDNRPRQDLMRLGRRRSKGRGKRRQDKKGRKDCEVGNEELVDVLLELAGEDSMIWE
ncbi:placenta growth factor isoform X1 [Turdus rufiventris]|nr:placenta growth factor isoform X1 [Turdus rufiventris]